MAEKKEVSKEMVLRRLKKIEGQIRGIEKMVNNGRDCESLIIQLAAVRSATESVGALILNNFMKLCLSKGDDIGSTNIDSLARAVAIWGGVRVGNGT